jgi:putative ABC transport system permease protein
MWKHRSLTLLGIIALAVGVGLNTAMFSVVNAVLLRPLPYRDPARLALLESYSQSGQLAGVSYPDYLDWRNQARSLSDMAALFNDGFNLTGMDLPEHLFGRKVSASYFRVVGVPPALGRDFTDDDDRPGAGPTVIISDSLWKRKFGKDRGVVGRSITLDDRLYTIVGVAPPSLAIQKSDFWIPISLFPRPTFLDRKWRDYIVVARLAPGVTEAQARAEMKTIAARLAVQYPDADRWFSAGLVGMVNYWTAAEKKPLLLLFGSSIVVLLLACVNVATVFLAGMAERRAELIVRLALGASRIVLLRQQLVQTMLLALAASLLGLAIARAGIAVVLATSADSVARLDETNIAGGVLWFVGLLAFAATVLLGVLPAAYALKLKISSTIREASVGASLSRSGVFGQRVLIVLQISLATSLSLASGLLIKSLYRATKVELGFDPQKIISFRIGLPEARYKEPETIVRYFERLTVGIKEVPGVHAVSAVSALPLSGRFSYILFHTEDGRTDVLGKKPFVDNINVAPGYFATLQVPLLQGRDFMDKDRLDAPAVAIVDDVLARQVWPGESALGKRIRLAVEGDAKPPWLEVVGVVKQVKQYGPEQEIPRMQVYIPLFQNPWRYMTLAIAFDGGEAGIKTAILKKAYDLDHDIPLYEYLRMDELYAELFGSRKLSLGLMSTFAGISVLLGLVGIYGIVANSVVRGRREHAIRLALGSTFSKAIMVIATPIWVCAAIGMLFGGATALLTGKLLSSFLFGVTPHDPKTYVAALAAVVVLVLLASLVPARKLRSLNPQQILRE